MKAKIDKASLAAVVVLVTGFSAMYFRWQDAQERTDKFIANKPKNEVDSRHLLGVVSAEGELGYDFNNVNRGI